MQLTEVTPDDVGDWDALTVDRPGGDVYQSLGWGAYRARWGWRVRHLVFEDGFRLLALERPWPVVGGSGAYLSRGPLHLDEPATTTADRLVSAADYLAGRGVDVVSSDAEVEAATGYPELLAARGFHRIEENQPARHRISVPLAGLSEEQALAAVLPRTRREIRIATAAGLRVVRHDLRAGPSPGDGFEAPAGDRAAAVASGFERLYDLLVETATRRGFRLGRREAFLDWCRTGHAAGHILLLEVVDEAGTTLGAGMFYRHGDRLTYSHGGDRAGVRGRVRGVSHLLQWRAIQLAVREGRREVDLGGVDVRGARRPPRPGESTHGLYEHKRSFGGRWIELSGNHERVVRPWRYRIGRVTARLARSVR